MRVVLTISSVCFGMLVLGQSGCEPPADVTSAPAKIDSGANVSVYSGYRAAKIRITPLTELVVSVDAQGSSKINVYVHLLDSFGSQIKSPGIFRFELYEYAQRSAEPKGRRVVIWPDMDLTAPAENNRYWHDFLRAYQFNLPLEQQSDQSYVLQVTFLCVSGKRLSDELILKYAK